MSQPTDRWGWITLGQMLVQDGILTQDQLSQRPRAAAEGEGTARSGPHRDAALDEEVLLKYLGAQFRKEPITQQELARSTSTW